MPRIYDSMSDPLDFCNNCFPNEQYAIKKYGDNLRENDQGPNHRGNCFGYDADHPSYGGEDYNCEICKELLTDEAN
jgi:hypothetical protein